MTFENILSALKQRDFKPIYLFDGEETYYMDVLTEYIAENVLNESEREFNQSVLYAQDVSPEELASVVKRFPMMAEYQVVIVKEAQGWAKKIDQILPLVEKPVPTTILVLNFRGKKLDGKRRLVKQAKKNGIVYTGAKLYPDKVGPWISDYCRSKKIDIDARATAIMAESIGSDLSALVKAFDRLEVVMEPGETITAAVVQKHIGISKDFNIFEFQKAIGLRDEARAMYIANYFANNQKEHHIIPTVAGLYRYFAKLIRVYGGGLPTDNKSLASRLGVHPYFVGEHKQAASNYSDITLLKVMDILHDIDLKSKGIGDSSSDKGHLVREMVARILRA